MLWAAAGSHKAGMVSSTLTPATKRMDMFGKDSNGPDKELEELWNAVVELRTAVKQLQKKLHEANLEEIQERTGMARAQWPDLPYS